MKKVQPCLLQQETSLKNGKLQLNFAIGVFKNLAIYDFWYWTKRPATFTFRNKIEFMQSKQLKKEETVTPKWSFAELELINMTFENYGHNWL